ncbi:MAG TPA: hypothetical protein PLB32_04055 [Acidobacteriota bacterium]|nr:hypothetical protein [Acidobacteriota bacterium]
MPSKELSHIFSQRISGKTLPVWCNIGLVIQFSTGCQGKPGFDLPEALVTLYFSFSKSVERESVVSSQIQAFKKTACFQKDNP